MLHSAGKSQCAPAQQSLPQLLVCEMLRTCNAEHWTLYLSDELLRDFYCIMAPYGAHLPTLPFPSLPPFSPRLFPFPPLPLFPSVLPSLPSLPFLPSMPPLHLFFCPTYPPLPAFPPLPPFPSHLPTHSSLPFSPLSPLLFPNLPFPFPYVHQIARIL